MVRGCRTGSVVRSLMVLLGGGRNGSVVEHDAGAQLCASAGGIEPGGGGNRVPRIDGHVAATAFGRRECGIELVPSAALERSVVDGAAAADAACAGCRLRTPGCALGGGCASGEQQ